MARITRGAAARKAAEDVTDHYVQQENRRQRKQAAKTRHDTKKQEMVQNEGHRREALAGLQMQLLTEARLKEIHASKARSNNTQSKPSPVSSSFLDPNIDPRLQLGYCTENKASWTRRAVVTEWYQWQLRNGKVDELTDSIYRGTISRLGRNLNEFEMALLFFGKQNMSKAIPFLKPGASHV
ncbi:hypothetical protein BJ508DRAFT_308473 [Ascobolus immersus RN42]|uniref:Uncharacterized protein n=1 Tax=Ascobolus immersus RN42 TaxID=1160509 RepID=A0A3N4HZU4_ASCIM|nr:hypothetical protein BJ508DRAFT_308473 [Ascobolus immersus RN42]